MAKAKGIMEDENVAVRATLFLDHVKTGDPKIHAPLPHTDDDIAGTLKDDSQLSQGRDGGLVLARVGLEDAQSCSREKFQGVDLEAALGGEGKSDGLFGWHIVSLV